MNIGQMIESPWSIPLSFGVRVTARISLDMTIMLALYLHLNSLQVPMRGIPASLFHIDPNMTGFMSMFL